MDKNGTISVTGACFLDIWYSTLKPNAPDELATHWCSFELSGVVRDQTVVDIVSRFVDIDGAFVLDGGCGYGGVSIAFSRAGTKVHGIDIDRLRLCGAAIRAREDWHISTISFQSATLERLPYSDQSLT